MQMSDPGLDPVVEVKKNFKDLGQLTERNTVSLVKVQAMDGFYYRRHVSIRCHPASP